MLKAVGRSDIAALKGLLKKGADPDVTGEGGITPLISAVLGNKLEGLKLLLEHKASVDKPGNYSVTALHWAVQNSRDERDIAAALIDGGANLNAVNGSGQTPLFCAVVYGKPRCVKLLLERKADTTIKANDGKTALDIAEGRKSEEIVSLFGFATTSAAPTASPAPRVDHESTPFSAAASSADSRSDADRADDKQPQPQRQQAQQPLQTQQQPDAQKKPKQMEIHTAASKGDLVALQAELDRGVDVNLSGHRGWTPLLFASSWGKLDAVKFLVKRKATVDHRASIGNTALMWACFYGNSDCAAFLLDNGADIHHRNELGETALISAAGQNKANCVKLLLERKADASAIPTSGRYARRPAMEIAMRKCHRETVSVLEFASAAAPPPAPPAPAPRVDSEAAAFAATSCTNADKADSKHSRPPQDTAVSTADPLKDVLIQRPSVVRLPQCRIGDAGLAALSSKLASIAEDDWRVTRLILYKNKLTDTGVDSLLDALKARSSLTELDLRGNAISLALLPAAHFPLSLQTLQLGGNPLSADGLEPVSALIRNSERLTALNLRSTKLSAVGVKQLACAIAECKRCALRSLNIQANPIGDDGAESLAAALRAVKLDTLFLGKCEIAERGAKHLASILADERCSLSFLNLRGNPLADGGCATLARGLGANRSLTALFLNKCKIGSEGAAALSRALAGNSRLETLILFDNPLGDAGAARICEGLARHPRLLTLDLGNTGCAAAGSAALASLLSNRSNLLVTLLLYRNALPADSLLKLAQSLATNTCLRTLELRGVGDALHSPAVQQAFAEAMTSNCCLLAINPAPSNAVAAALATSERAFQRSNAVQPEELKSLAVGTRVLMKSSRDDSQLWLLARVTEQPLLSNADAPEAAIVHLQPEGFPTKFTDNVPLSSNRVCWPQARPHLSNVDRAT